MTHYQLTADIISFSVKFKYRGWCSVSPSYLTLCDPVDCSTPGFPVYHQLPELAQTNVHHLVMPSNHLAFCCPLLLLPSILPRIRVFSHESVLHIRWPKYWSFNISPSNVYSGLISFRIDWCLLVVNYPAAYLGNWVQHFMFSFLRNLLRNTMKDLELLSLNLKKHKLYLLNGDLELVSLSV